MKKINLLLLLLFTIVSLHAQDYRISFLGSGASTNVGTVTVENLTQGKSVTLSGTEVLHLVKTITGIDPISDIESELRIYPNPTNGTSTIDFVATASGKANIELFNVSGKRVGTAQNIITHGTHSYQVSNLRSGIYTIRISSQSYNYTGKLVSNGTSNSDVKVNYIGNVVIPDKSMKLKSASVETEMQYNTGDRLKITGSSGIYSTVITDIPIQSKSITFNFVACTDADGNNYPVVQIGTQLWMAENLKTVKYRNGDPIPNVGTKWRYLVTGAYDWYSNDIKNNIYGALYNFYATMDSRNIAPEGWHVATFPEWEKLTSYLGGDVIAGNKLKMTGNYWRTNKLATNEAGFGALPGGMHGAEGTFYGIGENGNWWSPSEIVGKESSAITIYSINSLIYLKNGLYDERLGNSVRCIKD